MPLGFLNNQWALPLMLQMMSSAQNPWQSIPRVWALNTSVVDEVSPVGPLSCLVFLSCVLGALHPALAVCAVFLQAGRRAPRTSRLRAQWVWATANSEFRGISVCLPVFVCESDAATEALRDSGGVEVG